MKLLLVAAVFAVFLAIGEAKRCRSGDECDDGECCVAKGLFRRGECKKLSEKGEECSEEDMVIGFLDHKYLNHCPCSSGLSCEPTEVKELPFGITVRLDERCVGDGSLTTPVEPEPETTEPEPETTESEPETTEPEAQPE